MGFLQARGIRACTQAAPGWREADKHREEHT
jgi:hypothetical protein